LRTTGSREQGGGYLRGGYLHGPGVDSRASCGQRKAGRVRRQTRRRCVGPVWNRVAIPVPARLAPTCLAVLHRYRTSRMAH